MREVGDGAGHARGAVDPPKRKPLNPGHHLQGRGGVRLKAEGRMTPGSTGPTFFGESNRGGHAGTHGA